MTWFKKQLVQIFDKDRGVHYKNAVIKLVLPLMLVLFIAITWFSRFTLPGYSLSHYMIIAFSISMGLFLYISGLLISIIAFKKAHDLLRQNDGWRESVTVS